MDVIVPTSQKGLPLLNVNYRKDRKYIPKHVTSVVLYDNQLSPSKAKAKMTKIIAS